MLLPENTECFSQKTQNASRRNHRMLLAENTECFSQKSQNVSRRKAKNTEFKDRGIIIISFSEFCDTNSANSGYAF